MRFTDLSPAQDRALHELRQGRPLRLIDEAQAWHCQAIDTAAPPRLVPGGFALISGPRAHALALGDAKAPLAIPLDADADASVLPFLMGSNVQLTVPVASAPGFADALLALAKQGRLIPAFYVWPADAPDATTLSLQVSDLPLTPTAVQLRRLSTLTLPLDLHGQTLTTQAVLFEHASLQQDLLALNYGDPKPSDTPLVRLHSACLTGDVFGSLRCDCGPQLHKALHKIQADGQGSLLYLPQEGRDTGLRNKLRAYALQDAGLDTLDADATLGFEADERDFAMAAAVLQHLGLTQIRLMTNNPSKVAGLEAEGIQIVERVPLQIPAQAHNRAYQETKARRAGHDLGHL